MKWLAILSVLAKLDLVVLELARERPAQGTARAEALAESATHALELIRKARNARRAASDATADHGGCATTTASVGNWVERTIPKFAA